MTGPPGYVSQTVCIAGYGRPATGNQSAPLATNNLCSADTGYLSLGFTKSPTARTDFAVESPMKTIEMLVVLTPIKLSDVPEIHQDFDEATAFVLVTIFDEIIEIRGC
jgi:hypothetical protein